MINKTKPSVWVVIPAAGAGSRMEMSVPKQYLQLQGCPVLSHSLSLFLNHPEITGVVVVLSESDTRWDVEIAEDLRKKVLTVIGGKERVDSVRSGVDELLIHQNAAPDDWILVHDAARPCLTKSDLKRLLDTRETLKNGGALLVAPIVDTLKEVEQKQVVKTHDRNRFVRALTPQFALLSHLNQALNSATENGIAFTDEAQAMENVGYSMATIIGRQDNIKITFPSDLPLAQFILEQQAKLGLR